MNKFFTIISMLLFVAFANSTKKVSYLDIVSSLAQVTHVEGAGELAHQMVQSYAESLQKLQAYNAALDHQCNNILKRANEKHQNFQTAINNTNASIENMQNDNKETAAQIVQLQKDQHENEENAQKLKREIIEDAQTLQEKTLAIVERARVLRRLANLVEDELVGDQRNSTVGQYNVDKSLSGYSFVEVHSQLKELQSTHDPIVKSMITTLILITQDQKNIFANQETVGKIHNMIEEIIKRDASNGEQLRQQANEKRSAISKHLTELAETSAKNNNLIAEKRADIVQNNNAINFSKNAQNGMHRHMNQAAQRLKSNQEMCQKVRNLSQVEKHAANQGKQRFENLAKMVNEGH